MKTIKVSLKENSYNILIGQKILPRLGSAVKTANIGDDAVIITNPNIARRYGKLVIRSFHQAGISSKLFLVPEGEQSKSAEAAFGLISAIATYAALKKPFIVALGGGVIGDLAGFVAAVYRRGIPYMRLERYGLLIVIVLLYLGAFKQVVLPIVDYLSNLLGVNVP